MELKRVINQGNELMQQRCTIRKYDPSVKISKEVMANIIQDAITAPSSLNLQPWRFVVIDTEEGKKLIEPYMMFNRPQWETSSAIVAVFADTQNAGYAEEILAADVKYGLKTEEMKDSYIEKIKMFMSSYTPERQANSLMLDCGFVIMQFMLAAKTYGYDTNPIGGYMRKELSTALDMDTDRYLPVLLLSIGKAAEEAKDSVRLSVDQITQWR